MYNTQKNKKRTSIINDGIVYALNDFNMNITMSQDGCEVTYKCNNVEKCTSDKETISKELKQATMSGIENEVLSSTWQGNIIRIRSMDEHLIKHSCYNWLTSWKECPVNIINDLQSIHLQTVLTLAFANHRLTNPTNSKLCRLCHKGDETVKHLLSNCGNFVHVDYIRRHNKALQCILFP